jgi:hypothetical protein
MMKMYCKVTEGPYGMESAIKGMRAPKKSYEISDSYIDHSQESQITIGPKDQSLMLRLVKAGTDHGKCIRQIVVWMEIEAPRNWWSEFDTYRIGVEKQSESTMNSILKKPITSDDFEDSIPMEYLDFLNVLRASKQLQKLKDRLPEGYKQKRYVMASYQALRAIYKARRAHRLKTWAKFCDFLETIKYSWIITE